MSRPAETSPTPVVAPSAVHSGPTTTGELVARAQQAFGWSEDVVVSAGPRGALGQIWRLEVGLARYALKEMFTGSSSEASVAEELAFARRAARAGVRVPASHPALDGRHLIAGPDGTWLRLYDWVDLKPVDLTAPGTPTALGTLLARLHRCAPAAAVESGGGPPDCWYDRAPATNEWAAVSASDTAWAARLAERLAELPALSAAIAPADPGALITCHRDLHPENVLADPGGELVVVDWDDLGPADPGRELARALFDWFCVDSAVDLEAVRDMYDAYLGEGGPGRITGPADFSMLLASRLNFLLRQTRLAIEPGTEQRHRAWAEREIDEALHILPTPRQLAEVLELTRTR